MAQKSQLLSGQPPHIRRCDKCSAKKCDEKISSVSVEWNAQSRGNFVGHFYQSPGRWIGPRERCSTSEPSGDGGGGGQASKAQQSPHRRDVRDATVATAQKGEAILASLVSGWVRVFEELYAFQGLNPNKRSA